MASAIEEKTTVKKGTSEAQKAYQQRRAGLKSLTDAQLQDMINQANSLPEAIRAIAVHALNQEQERRNAPDAGEALAQRQERFKDLIANIKASLPQFEGAKSVNITLTYDDNGTLGLVDVHAKVASRARGKSYEATTPDGKLFTAPTLKELIVAVFPDIKRTNMNKTGYFQSKGVEVFAIAEDGTRTKAA